LEQSQGGAIEGKLWPRLSALAERLWTDPDTNWFAAETRLHIQRERWNTLQITLTTCFSLPYSNVIFKY
jgi:N-acetyl-beta-hexosaminidase